MPAGKQPIPETTLSKRSGQPMVRRLALNNRSTCGALVGFLSCLGRVERVLMEKDMHGQRRD